jgi:hypothetical protein
MRTPICGLIVAGICTAAAANDEEDFLKEARAEQRALAKQAAPPATAGTGDPDSFGRKVHFIGVGLTGVVSLQADCTPDANNPPFPDDRCFVPQAPPATTVIHAQNIGTIQLPAKATNSILCHSVTSLPLWHFSNPTASPGLAAFRYDAFMTIENEVLNNPNLIDPGTGLPFNGSLELGFSQITDTQTFRPGDQATRRNNTTRSCIGGLISKAALMDLGLSAAQADEFFKRPMTIHLHIQLATAFVDRALVRYGLRLYGD